MKVRQMIGVSLVAALIATAFAQTGRLDPRIRKFIEALEAKGGPPLYTLSPADARKVLETLQSQPAKKLDAKIEDLTIPGGPTKEVSVRIVRPGN
jgi:acetyl esterase